ncbi:MAG: DUF1080 domain-containing protein [Planctomycetaceae bacterium]|nr:DUF1080 domain-containing protein [Planctomycetaceae bacterium]
MKISRSLTFCVLLTAIASVAPAFAQDDKPQAKKQAQRRAAQQDWVELFDGKSLEGWEQKNGTAKYEVKDGAILGSTAEGSPNSFLCSQKNYGDFALEFEVKLLSDELNSGVQIRSHSKADYRDGRVHGPQVEIEASPGQAGYIYGEASTGAWISLEADATPTEHFKNGEWNKYRVRAVGPRIQVWINGEKITDVKNAEANNAANPGFIGLQVHSFKGPHPAQVMWKNIRIRELKPGQGGKNSEKPAME